MHSRRLIQSLVSVNWDFWTRAKSLLFVHMIWKTNEAFFFFLLVGHTFNPINKPPNKSTVCAFIVTIFWVLGVCTYLGPFFLGFLCFQWKKGVRNYWNLLFSGWGATLIWPLRTLRAPCIYFGFFFMHIDLLQLDLCPGSPLLVQEPPCQRGPQQWWPMDRSFFLCSQLGLHCIGTLVHGTPSPVCWAVPWTEGVPCVMTGLA